MKFSYDKLIIAETLTDKDSNRSTQKSDSASRNLEVETLKQELQQEESKKADAQEIM